MGIKHIFFVLVFYLLLHFTMLILLKTFILGKIAEDKREKCPVYSDCMIIREESKG